MENQRAATRPMDDLGRVVIPSDIREVLGWANGTKLEVAVGDVAAKTVLLREHEVLPCCSLCRQESENLRKVNKGYLCHVCAVQVAQIK